MGIRIWGRPSSARTQKVLLALAELGLPFEFTLASATMGEGGHVAKGNKAFGVVDTADYLAMNPNGTVPTLKDGEYVLWESNAILQYLAMTYGPAGFYGSDIGRFASAARWIMWENNELIPPMHNLVKHTIRLPETERDPAVARQSRAQLEKAWGVVEAELGRNRYIADDAWSYGDIPMTIRVHRWALLEGAEKLTPNLARYYRQVSERPSFEAIRDPAMHLAG
ncbi:glutathione S-transferase family protein [Nisaea acidiphila]|uniref:Glutathione S-transferase family protein n=1 Tax=Nisaea acidiphila TaxID=1862145 RepID=A0A9J7AXM4_9PROT|nr:glutathione S-transferase family protein [Nisaea acidiphila]UUX52040.1 glutathione S-transferase family protein [Nisaea acidiphila]